MDLSPFLTSKDLGKARRLDEEAMKTKRKRM